MPKKPTDLQHMEKEEEGVDEQEAAAAEKAGEMMDKKERVKDGREEAGGDEGGDEGGKKVDKEVNKEVDKEVDKEGDKGDEKVAKDEGD
jgi:hypothetical protein